MNRFRCPHCDFKLGNYLYADECPHCHEEMKHNTRLLSVPVRVSTKGNAWLVRFFNRLLRLVES